MKRLCLTVNTIVLTLDRRVISKLVNENILMDRLNLFKGWLIESSNLMSIRYFGAKAVDSDIRSTRHWPHSGGNACQVDCLTFVGKFCSEFLLRMIGIGEIFLKSKKDVRVFVANSEMIEPCFEWFYGDVVMVEIPATDGPKPK